MGGTGTYTFDVYLGTSVQELILVSPDLAMTTYDPGVLEYATRYYWKVVQKEAGVPTAEAEVWDFQTLVPVCDPPLAGDVTGDCYVDLNDLAQLTSDWLRCNLVPVDACP